jgi:hypothetical protein
VRTLCFHCKRAVRLSAALLQDNGFVATEPVQAFEAVGCGPCGGNGWPRSRARPAQRTGVAK